jgi:hypothetical protein
MALRASDSIHFIDSVTCTGYDPEYNRVDEGELNKYLKEHPFPKDPNYSIEDLKNDLLYSSGLYTLPRGVKEKTVEYIEDLLNELIQ